MNVWKPCPTLLRGVLCSFLFLLSSGAMAVTLPDEYKAEPFEQALARSAQDGKPLMLFFSGAG